MTNKKAIQLLQRISDSQFDGIHGDERREALEMAVRALEPNLGQKTIDCIIKRLNDEDRTMDDLISRKMAIDAIEEMQMPIMRSGSPIDQSVFTGMGRALQAIKDLPSAQPQRKKGKWIILPPIFEEICQCSKCKMKFKDALQWTNYCPNCGADMRGESDG